MCGIVGLLNRSESKPVRIDQIRLMNDTITHRGPDDAGEMVFGSFGMGMRRLSIIDLSNGHQPLCNEDESVWVVFNGEIYNHQEIRESLIQAGHTFKTQSDTEVFVHAYEQYGDDFIRRFNGMFGFALWDQKKKKLILGRDRVGIKPLYYYLDSQTLAFASETKAILTLESIPKEIDPNALDEFLSLEYVVAPQTLVKNIRKLKAGHVLIVENGVVQEKPYWTPAVEPRVMSEEEACERLRLEMRTSIRRRLMSDVPLGAFLSGGIDSSIIVGLMSEMQGRPVQTFSIGFKEASYNESHYARLVSKHFGTDHHETMLSLDPKGFLDDFKNYLDEPNGDVSLIPTFLLSKVARKNVKVCLSGDGGDELFGGYDTYVADGLGRSYDRFMPRFLQSPVAAGAAILPPTEKKKGLINRIKRFTEGMAHPQWVEHYRWMMFMTDRDKESLYQNDFYSSLRHNKVYDDLADVFMNANPRWDRLTKQSFVDLKVYLAEDILNKVDVTSMANSLEVRVPFLDHHVVECALSMPGNLKIKNGQRKYILKKAFEKMLPKPILTRGKEGFSIPLKNWLRQDLRESMHDVLNQRSINELGIFNWSQVNRWMEEHEDGRQNHAHRLWGLMVFHLWHKKYMTSIQEREVCVA